MEPVTENSVEDLKRIDAEIEQQIRDKIKSDDPELEVVPDGIVDFEEYLKARFKILWILKEPYDDIDNNGKPFGGGWHLRQVILERNSFDQYTGGRRTFEPMIYTTWGILNDFCQWQDMKDVRDDSDMLKALRSIAYINVKKIPGRTSSPQSEIEYAYEQHQDILHEQIRKYDPDIIICGATLFHFMPRLGIKREELISAGSVNYVIREKKIYIEAYHPAQRKSSTGVSQKDYCNDIINLIKNHVIHLKSIV